MSYPDIFWDKNYFNANKWWTQFSFVWRAIGLNRKYNCGCDKGQFLCDYHAEQWTKVYG